MKIIAHRGNWMDPEEKNSTLAIERGILNFDGIETDIRDVHKNLAVSHDMPEGRVIFFEKILSDCCDTEKVFAINIKADGLSDFEDRYCLLCV